ncbi:MULTISPECIES: hypothetical protein [unclassified Microbacterium]|uniref:hypothetical protein n=1 Tax=unclassified Microbacterium TaxID=2609290 RepID=UPI00109C0683|nr:MULTISPECIES: hypothetical protein [unclassified Microbacterium]
MFDEPGFISGRDEQRGIDVSLFTWGGADHAEQFLIPRHYLVVCMQGGRWRLPTVEWEPFLPQSSQHTRPWADVLAEFDEVFLPMLAGGPAPMGERHVLERGLPEKLADAGVSVVRYRSRVHTLDLDGHRLTLDVTDGALRLYNDTRGLALDLHTGLAWADVTGWISEASVSLTAG